MLQFIKQFFIKITCISSLIVINLLCFRRSGGMADASDSKSDDGDIVWVQVPSPAFWAQKGNLTDSLFIFLSLPRRKYGMCRIGCRI